MATIVYINTKDISPQDALIAAGMLTGETQVFVQQQTEADDEPGSMLDGILRSRFNWPYGLKEFRTVGRRICFAVDDTAPSKMLTLTGKAGGHYVFCFALEDTDLIPSSHAGLMVTKYREISKEVIKTIPAGSLQTKFQVTLPYKLELSVTTPVSLCKMTADLRKVNSGVGETTSVEPTNPMTVTQVLDGIRRGSINSNTVCLKITNGKGEESRIPALNDINIILSALISTQLVRLETE